MEKNILLTGAFYVGLLDGLLDGLLGVAGSCWDDPASTDVMLLAADWKNLGFFNY